jgi:hypothetical protein
MDTVKGLFEMIKFLVVMLSCGAIVAVVGWFLLFLLSFLPFPFGLIIFLGVPVVFGVMCCSRSGKSRVYEPDEDAGGL